MTAISLTVVQSIDELRVDRITGEILTLNPELLSLIASECEPDYLKQFSLCTIDSAPLTALLRFKGINAARYPGVDLVSDLLRAHGAARNILFFGARPGVAARVAQSFGVQNALVFDGYTDSVDSVVAKCRERGFVPDIALVALGGLLQFEATKRIMDELQPRIAVACGGSFDVLSGDMPRAPGWMQRIGMEWAFRVARQPARAVRLGAVLRGLILARQVLAVTECRKSITFSFSPNMGS